MYENHLNFINSALWSIQPKDVFLNWIKIEFVFIAIEDDVNANERGDGVSTSTSFI